MRAAFLLSILVLAAGVLLFGLRPDSGSTDRETPATEIARGASPRPALAATAEAEKPAPRVIDREHPGYAVYTRRGCNVCHGPDLGGTNMAPSLHAASEHWNAESFARYLANPDSSIRADERLKALDAKYGMFVMPSYPLDAKELEPLTSLVLGEQD